MTKSIAIFGLGISGVSAAKYYSEKKNVRVFVDDDNKESLGKLNNTNIIKKKFIDWDWSKIQFLIFSVRAFR